MKYLNNLIFEDLMDRFRWYQKSFRLDIFCIDKKSADIFEKEIDKQELHLNKERTKEYLMYKGKLQTITITIFPYYENKNSFCGRRANAIILDSHIPMDIVYELFLPMANIEPSYGIITFQKSNFRNRFKKENSIAGKRLSNKI